jgi:hypothetical protein
MLYFRSSTTSEMSTENDRTYWIKSFAFVDRVADGSGGLCHLLVAYQKIPDAGLRAANDE